MNIGFLGLGTMGSAIAENLLRAGHTLTVWNRSPGPADRLRAQGALVARRPADALQGDVAFSMLANDQAIREVGLDGALLADAASGLVHANISTVSIAFARAMAAAHARHGVGYVATTVFGRSDVAAAGKLVVVAAGKADSVERVRSLLDVVGRRTVVLGEAPEQANLFKIAGNFMLASVIETFGEALALARKGGVDPALFYEVMTSSLFAGPAFQGYGKMIVEETHEPAGFELRLGLKDVDLALAAASELTVPLPLGGLMHDQFVEALNRGLAAKDWVALASHIADKAGLPTRTFSNA